MSDQKHRSAGWQKRMKEWKNQVEEQQLFNEQISKHLKKAFGEKKAYELEKELLSER